MDSYKPHSHRRKETETARNPSSRTASAEPLHKSTPLHGGVIPKSSPTINLLGAVNFRGDSTPVSHHKPARMPDECGPLRPDGY